MHSSKPKIRLRTNTAGTTSYCVDAGMINGKRYRKFFKTKEEAKKHRSQIANAKEQQGALAFSLSPEQQVEAGKAFEALRNFNVPISEAVAFYIKHNQPKNGQKPIQEIVEEFLKIKERNGAKARYVQALRCAYGNFTRSFGEKNVHEMSRKEAEEWVHSQKFSNLTKRNYLRDLGMLFKFASEEGYCSENVIRRIAKPKAGETPVQIFSVSNAQLLLFCAQRVDPELIPYIAIGLFAGLRSSELETLDWDEISFAQRSIEVKAAKAKTSRRRVVEMSDNLLKWLEPYQTSQGSIVKPGWRDRLQKIAKDACLKWPQNGLRHSFGTYHLAFYQNAAKTALQMGHETPKMLFAHYREVVSREEAARYWNILPTDGWYIKPAEPAKSQKGKSLPPTDLKPKSRSFLNRPVFLESRAQTNKPGGLRLFRSESFA